MKKLVVMVLNIVSVGFCAQPVLTLTGPNGNVKAGSTVQLSVSVSGTTGFNVAAIQGSIILPGTFVSCAVGGASTAAGKSVDCGVSGGGSNLIFIASGINTNVYADGVVALVTVNIPVGAAGGATTVGLSNTLSASLTGDGVVTTPGVNFSLGITSQCDIDSSGTTDSTDVGLVKAAMLSGSNSIDLNKDGKTDVIDLQRVINAIGGTCKVN